MSLFELDDGRLIPAQFGRTVTTGLSDDILETVRSQVLEIVQRPLFPVTWRDLSRVPDPAHEEPRLTALDATGQVVSVEVLTHLDSETLIASLSRLADTAALSWTDLAQEYPGGVNSFKAGWHQFRDSMPPAPGAGPRLVMVVGAIDPQVRPALEVLAASGVEVHEIALRRMSNGRSFLDVNAVGSRLYGHVPQLLGQGAGSEALPERAVQAALGVETVSADVIEQNVVSPSASAGSAAVAEVPRSAGTLPSRREMREQEEARLASESAEISLHSSVERSDNEPIEVAQAREAGVPVLDRDSGALSILGQLLGSSAPLVAHPDLGVDATVVMEITGIIRVDNTPYEDVHTAFAACGVTDKSGWDEWHLGDMLGPTLGEALDEVNVDIVREYRAQATTVG